MQNKGLQMVPENQDDHKMQMKGLVIVLDTPT